ncbi:hypothetical protein Tco_1089240 [Tanacetum coccineum]
MLTPEGKLGHIRMAAIKHDRSTAINSGTSAKYPRRIDTCSTEEKGSGPRTRQSHPRRSAETSRSGDHERSPLSLEGMFLGYMISPEGIKPRPDKTEAVLQLLSPRTIKEVQSLNGKLASLNRFLSKSSEKSLPLFKTLKKYIKKSNFHWTL